MTKSFQKYFYLKLAMVFTFALFFVNILPAQNQMSFRNLTKKEGLSQASVFAIEQDDKGFMWFGTKDGLNKFDGYQFTVYRSSEKEGSIVANDVRTLFFDKKMDDLWIGTSSGLSRYRQEKDDFVTSQSDEAFDINTISIRTIFRDSKDRLWVGTVKGLYLYQEDKNYFIRFFRNTTKENTLSDNDVKVILEGRDGTIYFGTKKGINRLIENGDRAYSFERMAISKQLSDDHIKALLEDEKGNIWIGTRDGGINYWDKSNQSITSFVHQPDNENSISNNNVRSMIWGRDGDIWIGTFYGLNKFSPKTQQFVRILHNAAFPSSLSHSSVRACFLDERGSLWLGTYAGGINFWDEANTRFSNFTYHPFRNSISNNLVSCFTEDQNGNWWIGTEGGGLNFFDNKTQQFTAYQHQEGLENSLVGNSVKTLLLEESQLWVGTYRAGMTLLDIPSQQFTHFRSDPLNYNSISSNNVYGLCKDGQNIWMATHGGGLNILNIDNKKNKVFKYNLADSTSISSDLCRVILKTKDGQKWIATDNGLNKVHCNQQGIPESFSRSLVNKKIYTLFEDDNGFIWAGTLSSGLFQLDKDQKIIAHFTTADGLPSNGIFGILLDKENNFWLSTNNGISKFDLSNKSFTNYNYSDGLENLEFNFNAYYKTSTGDMLFGGMNGFTFFNPSDIATNTFIPPVVFTHLEAHNKAVAVTENGILKKVLNETEQLTFNYKEANFSISFAALDYFSPENNRFAYYLEGLDEDWIHTTGKTEATYTIQNAGDYLFKLKVGNSDGIWNVKERQLKITVLPPPWKTAGAYFVYFLLGLGVVYGLIRFFNLRHRLELEQITQKQQQEIHEVKVQFFTNITHEFRTPLTLILGQLEELSRFNNNIPPNEKQKLFSVKRNAKRLLNLVNQLLVFRRLETKHTQLKVEASNIVSFLQDIVLSFQQTATTEGIDLQLETTTEEIMLWFDKDKLERVFFNLLSNAFKFTPEGGKIRLKLEKEKNQVAISVADNGVGIEQHLHGQVFEQFYKTEIPFEGRIKGSGMGLAIAKQLVELHLGKIELKSEKNQGATFTVRLPMGQSHFKEKDLIPHLVQQKYVNNKIEIPVSAVDYSLENGNVEELLNEDSFKLLIVEDNEEVSEFIQSVFKNEYHIATAINGKLGLKVAKKIQPDIIISDVMMPEMDGIQLCEILKTDIETSHIPIILLTAKTALESKLEGLKNGADDYVTKPFNPSELKLRVRNLVNARIKLRNKFARILNLEPTEITVTSADETFLANAMDAVEKNMANTNFDVKQFGNELAVSRPLLFTKLKSITGQTPNNFIKTIRLKRAAQILKQKKLNVSEVAYQVGFKDPRYFSKCFQQQFDQTPTEYMAAV